MKKLALLSTLLISSNTFAYNLSVFYSDEETNSINEKTFIHNDEFVNEVETFTLKKNETFHSNKTFNILVVYPGGQKSDYWRESNKVYANICKHYLTGCNLEFYSTYEKNPTEEIHHILEATSRDLDYLVYHVDKPYQAKLVKRILEETNTEVLLNNTTLLRRDWDGRKPLIVAGFDHYIGSKILADLYNTMHASGGKNYIGVFREDGLVNEARWNGFKDNLYSSFVLKKIIYKDDNKPLNAESLINAAKEHNASIIFSTSTDITIEIVNALKDVNSKPLINGWGCTQEEIEMVRKRLISNCIFRNMNDVPISIMKAIEWDIKGKVSPIVYRGRISVTGIEDDLQLYSLREAKRVSSYNE